MAAPVAATTLCEAGVEDDDSADVVDHTPVPVCSVGAVPLCQPEVLVVGHATSLTRAT